MADIIDPYNYKDRLTMPMMLMTSSGDEFFMPDDSHWYLKHLIAPSPPPPLPLHTHSLSHARTQVLQGSDRP
jgi:PhoPQ-activated pathogenicity-related protein